MQAVSALTGRTFAYSIHEWGPDSAPNPRAIAEFKMWIAVNGGGR